MCVCMSIYRCRLNIIRIIYRDVCSVWVFSFFIFVINTIIPVVHLCGLVGHPSVWAQYLALGCGFASCEEIGFDADDMIDDYTVFYSLYMYNLNPLIQLNHF